MDFAIVFDFLIAFRLDNFTIFQNKLVGCFLKILILNQYALENFRIKSKGSTTL